MRKRIISFLMIIFTLLISSVNGIAAGPLDGQIIDGSLLTSENSARDEQPLTVQTGLNNHSIVPYGTYLSNGASEITNQGGGLVYVSGSTYCYSVSDKVQITLYLERLSNGGWSTYKTHSRTAYNDYVISTGLGFAVPKGYYYRVRGAQIVTKGSTVESCTTCTSAIYIG